MKNRNMVLLCTISLLMGMVFYGPIATLYRQAAGLTLFQITLIESASLAFSLVMELPWGIVADRIGYKSTMVICCALYFISKLVFWQADSFGGFLAERLLLSVILAGLSGVDSSLLYLSVPPEKAQRAFGIYDALSTVGLLFAAGVYSLLIGTHYRFAGLLTAVSYGAAALLSLLLVEVRPPEPCRASGRAFLSCLAELGKRPGLLCFLIACALFNECHQTITVFLNQPQYVRCGLSDRMIGLIYIAVTLAGLIGALSHRVTRRLGEQASARLFLLSGGAACAALALTRSPVVSAGAIILLRVSYQLFRPLWSTLEQRQVVSVHRATALSINSLLVNSVGVATNMVFGKLADSSLPLAMWFGAGLCAGSFILFTLYRRTQSSS